VDTRLMQVERYITNPNIVTAQTTRTPPAPPVAGKLRFSVA
jgi:hypothetical protein